MIERTIARRYATALLTLADQAKQVEVVESDLLQVAAAWDKDAGFRRVMTHPVIAAKDKKALFRSAFPGIAPLLAQFLDKLIDKKRGGLLPEIAEVFDDLADKYAGVVRMTVETAVPLTDGQRAKLMGRLTGISGGRKVEIDPKVVPELLGGMRLRVRDTVIDGTVAGRLKGLREALTSTMR